MLRTVFGKLFSFVHCALALSLGEITGRRCGTNESFHAPSCEAWCNLELRRAGYGRATSTVAQRQTKACVRACRREGACDRGGLALALGAWECAERTPVSSGCLCRGGANASCAQWCANVGFADSLAAATRLCSAGCLASGQCELPWPRFAQTERARACVRRCAEKGAGVACQAGCQWRGPATDGPCSAWCVTALTSNELEVSALTFEGPGVGWRLVSTGGEAPSAARLRRCQRGCAAAGASEKSTHSSQDVTDDGRVSSYAFAASVVLLSAFALVSALWGLWLVGAL